MLPPDLKNINFNWIKLDKNISIEQYIEMVNDIPGYYHVEILLNKNIFDVDGPKWPIYIVDYIEHEWSPDIYEIQNKYTHSIHGPITVLINKESYQPYSSAKSAIK